MPIRKTYDVICDAAGCLAVFEEAVVFMAGSRMRATDAAIRNVQKHGWHVWADDRERDRRPVTRFLCPGHNELRMQGANVHEMVPVPAAA